MDEQRPDRGPRGTIDAAHVVLPCADLRPTLDFLVERLGFRLERIAPADDPRAALVSGHGLRIALEPAAGPPGTLRLLCSDPGAVAGGERELLLPNGTRVELVEASPSLVVPAGSGVPSVARAGDDVRWVLGRAGMLYRDLVPGRLGGRLIASHIRIPDGGPVPDQVHYHVVRFQLIYCLKGQVRLVYEDQGEPFVLAAGDAVLQPPRIRHRVLECSPGLEVIEVTCPAEHETFLDHELRLPTEALRPGRAFDGQRFVRHVAREAAWEPSRAGFQARDLGLSAATDGLVGARVLRGAGAAPAGEGWGDPSRLCFACVLAGELALALAGVEAEPLVLRAGDALTLPEGCPCRIAARSSDLELLEVRVSGVA